MSMKRLVGVALRYAGAVVMSVMATFCALVLLVTGKPHLLPVTFPLAALAVAQVFLVRQRANKAGG